MAREITQSEGGRGGTSLNVGNDIGSCIEQVKGYEANHPVRKMFRPCRSVQPLCRDDSDAKW